MTAFNLSITNDTQSHSVDISAAGLRALLDALDVGSDGFGQTDTDEAEHAETEAWLVIGKIKLALDMPPPGSRCQPIDLTTGEAGEHSDPLP